MRSMHLNLHVIITDKLGMKINKLFVFPFAIVGDTISFIYVGQFKVSEKVGTDPCFASLACVISIFVPNRSCNE